MELEGPIQLVECSRDGEIRVNPEAIRTLSHLPPPLRVVSIFGPRQTGKSFLLNALAGSTGFSVSKGSNHKELAINMWVLPVTEDPYYTLILLDTEGYEEDLDIEAAAFTCPIFTLSVLLSSMFLYNSWGPVSTDVLDQLLHITTLTNQVNLPAIGLAGESLLPKFVWCVRDFDAGMVMGDVELVPEDFLDSVFNDAKDLQSPSGIICKLFSRDRMEIFTFCHPQDGAEPLDEIPMCMLEPSFLRQAYVLKRSFSRSSLKVFRDYQALSGRELGDILEQFVDSMSRGSLILLDLVLSRDHEVSREEQEVPPKWQEFPVKEQEVPPKWQEFPVKEQEVPPKWQEFPVKEQEVPPKWQEFPVKEQEVPPKWQEFPVKEQEVPPNWQQPVVENVMPLREAPADRPRAASASGGAGKIPVGHPVDMEKPVCLIENTSAGELQVNQEALKILNSIRQPVVVVSIVGMYRTGKSYLMNRLAGKQTGFSLGSTVQAETKGIWMWCVPHPHRDNQSLVLLDTEGLGDVEKGDSKNDIWIFSLAVLLSSTFIYNSMGNINNEAVMSLHYVTELTKHIKVKSIKEKEEDTTTDYVRFFPNFVWAVRDFTLELMIDGKAATADQYLENSLKLKNGASKAVIISNDARECIRNYFQDRKCFVFDHPGSKEQLKLLDKLPDSELDPQFVEQTSAFCNYVFSCSKEKTMKGGISVTGNLLGNLAVTYVDAIRCGSVPCLENAVDALSQIENSEAIEESFALYRRLLGKRVKLHTETREELSRVHDGCLKEALQLFMKRSFKDEDHKYQEALMERVKAEYDQKCRNNEDMSRDFCAALLFQLEDDIHMGPEERYMKPGGYNRFKADLKNLVSLYKNKPAKGVKAEEALNDYLKEKNEREKMILTADRNLSAQERRLEEQRAQAEREKQRADAEREKQRALEEKINDIERARRENERQLREKMERDRITLMQENQRVMDQRLREQRALMEEGQKQKAKQLEAQIQQLRNQNSSQRNTRRRGVCVLS
ncbi:guanylate-binding protein 1-like [Conger conger]|uniref:guanylate-binding protein 1-like n=1 Tax=Conger conger TaxID=82655 RepID=UPI002A5A7630|nr:guanylate-binding protein 1-like [Conger conger]